jgi:predicted DNA-binding transcriptional regulator AlpA
MISTTTLAPAVVQLLDAEAVCKALGCSRIGLWRLMKRSDFPQALRFDPSNPRSRLKWTASSIEKFVSHLQQQTIDAQISAAPRRLHLTRQ